MQLAESSHPRFRPSAVGPLPTDLPEATHPHQVAQCDRQADGQGRGAHRAGAARVGGGEDAERQLECQDELHHHCLAGGRVVVELQAESQLGPHLPGAPRASGPRLGKRGDWLLGAPGESQVLRMAPGKATAGDRRCFAVCTSPKLLNTVPSASSAQAPTPTSWHSPSLLWAAAQFVCCKLPPASCLCLTRCRCQPQTRLSSAADSRLDNGHRSPPLCLISEPSLHGMVGGLAGRVMESRTVG